MKIKRVLINSIKNIQSDLPWFDFSFNELEETIDIVEANQGKSDIITREGLNDKINLKDSINQAKADFLLTGEDDLYCYAMYLDKTVHFVKSSDLPSEILAHLGFYYAETDELELLQFVDLSNGKMGE